MITGKLNDETAGRLARDLPWMRACFDWLEQERPWSADTEEVGEGIVVKKVEYVTSDPTPCRFENHRREVDLQVVVEGIEWIEIAHPGEVGEAIEENVDGDVDFYATPEGPVTRLLLGEGCFAVFFPEDVHRCGASVAEAATLRKYVFKVSRAVHSL